MIQISVNIDVDNLEKAADFYCRAFALEVGRRFGPHAIELLGANSPIYLLAKEADSAPVRKTELKRDYHRHWTPVHVDFIVEKVEPALERALAAGARQESTVREYDWGRIVVCADPWGHGFCLLQFTEKGYDAIATRGP
jgi:predicted enzyme related to lactoylglutathione lyase